MKNAELRKTRAEIVAAAPGGAGRERHHARRRFGLRSAPTGKGAYAAVSLAMVLAASRASAQEASATPTENPGSVTADAAPAPSIEDLVKLKQNPVSGLRQILFQADDNPDYPGPGKTQGVYSLQAVWPFAINADYRLVTYTIAPVYNVPGQAGENTVNGLGDALINVFVSPTKAGALVWGAGPSILLPTRSNAALGSSHVALGPAALIFYPKDNWSAGLIVQNGWSLGGGPGVNKVNAFGAQYLLVHL